MEELEILVWVCLSLTSHILFCWSDAIDSKSHVMQSIQKGVTAPIWKCIPGVRPLMVCCLTYENCTVLLPKYAKWVEN